MGAAVVGAGVVGDGVGVVVVGGGAVASGDRVTVVSSKFTVSPARTVTVPAVLPGVSTPLEEILHPRSGLLMLNLGFAAFPSESTVIVEVVTAGGFVPGVAGGAFFPFGRGGAVTGIEDGLAAQLRKMVGPA